MSDTVAERSVVVLVKDLFFAGKIENELRGHGYRPIKARRTDQFIQLLAEHQPVLGVIDIGAGVDWEQIAALTAEPPTPEIPILAFGPHKDVEGLRAAKAAGVTRVVSNSQFHADL